MVATRVKCLACDQAVFPIPRGLLDDEDGEPKWSACKCGAISTSQENGTVIVYYRTDGPLGPRPFEFVYPAAKKAAETDTNTDTP